MGIELPSGAILSSNLAGGLIGGEQIELSSSALRIGQIIEVLYTDDPKNYSKTNVEYNVLVNEDDQVKMIYRNCRTVDAFGSQNNFNEILLQPTTFSPKGAPDIKEQYQYKNGAIVVIGFINNAKTNAVILAGIQHPALNNQIVTDNVTPFEGIGSSISRDNLLKELPTLYPGSETPTKEGPATNDGQRIMGEFNGIRWNINPAGEFTIVFQGLKDAKGNIIDPITQPTILKINKDGEFFIIDNLDQEIKISRKDEAIIISDGQVNPNIITIDRKNNHITVKSVKTVQVVAPKVDVAADTSIITGETVKLGGKDAKQQVILGNDFMVLYNALVDMVLSHVHTNVKPSLSPTDISGTYDPITTPIPPGKMTNSQHLSQNVKVDHVFSGKPDLS